MTSKLPQYYYKLQILVCILAKKSVLFMVSIFRTKKVHWHVKQNISDLMYLKTAKYYEKFTKQQNLDLVGKIKS